MSTRVTKRRRHNKVVRVLAELYEFNYSIVNRLYQMYQGCIKTTKMHLKVLADIRAELDFIDSINLSF